MASIETRQRADGASYRVTWRNPDRGGATESSTWGDKTMAERAKKLAEAHDGRITKRVVEATLLGTPIEDETPRPPTVEAWSKTWLASRTRLSSGQVGRYEQQLRDWIIPAIGHLRLDEVEGTQISALLNALRAKVQPTTVTRYYACIHAMFAAAMLDKKITDNPAKRTDFIRDLIAEDDVDEVGADHVYLTPAEYQRIWQHLPPAAQALADYLINTGARFGEATAAAPESIDLDNRTARIYRAWKQRKDGTWHLGVPKSKGKRGVPIGIAYAKRLVPLLEERAGENLLFVTAVNTSSGGGPRGGGMRWRHSNFVNRYWDVAVGKAMRCELHPPSLPDKPVRGPRRGWLPAEVSTCDCPERLKRRPTPHDLRHSYVAWMLAAGRPLASISKRLGHFSVTLTERVYAGLLPEVDEADGAVVDAALSAWR